MRPPILFYRPLNSGFLMLEERVGEAGERGFIDRGRERGEGGTIGGGMKVNTAWLSW